MSTISKLRGIVIVALIIVTSLSFVGPASQTPKEEGRGPGQPGEILGLKRPYDVMEGGISRGLPMRDSLSAANCEGNLTLCHSHKGLLDIILFDPCLITFNSRY